MCYLWTNNEVNEFTWVNDKYTGNESLSTARRTGGLSINLPVTQDIASGGVFGGTYSSAEE